MTSIDLRTLRYFLAVADCGSYSEAALELDVSQPAVSRQMALLQEMMKTRLFRRNGRRYVLTEAGTALYQHARRIMDEVDVLNDVVRGANAHPGGHLAVGVPATIGEALMPRLLLQYRAKYPDVSVRLLQSDSTTLANLVALGKLDMALVYGRPMLNELELRTLAQLDLGLVAPREKLATKFSPKLRANQRISLRDAVALPLILSSKGSELRRVFDRAAAGLSMTPNVVLEVDGINLAKSLVAEGLGCMVLAYSGVSNEVKLGRLQFFPITRPKIPLALSVALRRSKQETPAMSAMLAEWSAAIGDAVSR